MTSAQAPIQTLTDDRLLRRNVALNLLGWALPVAAALLSVPMLSRGLGAERFGILALAWAAVGIFSLFDFGLGRALTRMVAERLARDAVHEIPDLVWAASWLLLGLTSILAVIGVVTAPSIVNVVLHVPPEFHAEAIGAVRLLSICIPPLAHGVALRGVLEAGQRFGRVNQLRIPLGIASYAGPLIAIPLAGDARIAVGVIVVARVAYWLAHFPFLSEITPAVSRPRLPSWAAVHELARVGGWITVSNVVSPIIVQADRAVVAAAFPIAASGWYGAAAEVATKQWLLTAALLPVVFSALAATIVTDPGRAAALAERASRTILLALLPVVVALVAFAEPALRLWLGGPYVPEAGSALRWLSIAVYLNALGQVAYALLQGGLDARAPALVHLAELPLYLALLALLAATLGVDGVAIAWLARMAIDTVVLWWIAYRRMPTARASVLRIGRLAIQCVLVVAAAAIWGTLRF